MKRTEHRQRDRPPSKRPYELAKSIAAIVTTATTIATVLVLGDLLFMIAVIAIAAFVLASINRVTQVQ